MNTKQFKHLIKECVREVLKEELPQLLTEGKLLKENQEFSFTSGDFIKKQGVDPNTVRNQLRSKMNSAFGLQAAAQQYKQLEVKPESENPFMDFILDAGENMTPQDRSGLRNL